MIRFVPTVLLFACTASVACADDTTSREVEFFEKQIRPILVESCYECHQGDADDVEGGLQVDSREGLLRGGTRGPAIVVGKPKESLLMLAINHADQLHMPPKSKLSQREIENIGEWIERGAFWPNSLPVPTATVTIQTPDAPQCYEDFSLETRNFWAFQPPKYTGRPDVQNADWIRTSIDGYILARLEAEGLAPAPEADRRTWLRRVTYDLTGLPPTPDEIHEFIADRSADAYPQVVDRLLASPRYGERWARHWLDVARYADSNGLDENLAYAHAYRYRDYIIGAIAADKPYRDLVLEQLAGDLLPAQDALSQSDHWIATAFLSLGAKMLAEDDPVKMQMDIVDEQVDTIGRAFMGLTLGCARCHDHKFDPITTSDYYALAGILKSTKTMENFQVVARWQERPISSTELIEQHAAISKQLASLSTEDARRDELQRQLPVLEYAMAVSEGIPEDLRIHIRGSHVTLGPTVPRRLPAVFNRRSFDSTENAVGIPGNQSGRLELAQWLVRADHPLTARVIVNRIWHWHFGRGLVASTDNFGHLGERPSHPALLDALALQIQRQNWSIKSLHREIVLSATYRMSCAYNAAAMERDPENRLLWRMNRRRLEAEEIRDAILMTTGQLDLQMGGSLLPTENRKYVTSTANVNPAIYDSRRRSVYLPVIRSALYDVFQAFDFPDPSVLSGQRQSTTVPPQALFVMNSQLVARQTRRWAESLLSDRSLDDKARIDRIYEALLSRLPSEEEHHLAEEYLLHADGATRPTTGSASNFGTSAWQSLGRAIMTTNEFIYLN